MARKDRKALDGGGTKSKSPKKSPEQIFAEKVRYHKDLDSRWAVLQETRVEYFRGRDFGALIRKHPELAHALIPKEEAEQLHKPLEEVLAEALLEADLIVRCDRVVKTIRPGRKKLSKWPAKLEVHPLQTYTTEEGFYSWTFPRQQPMWQTVLTVLFPVFTIACCLFPVFPYWAKLTVLYLLLSLLAAIFLLLFVRLLVFAVIWVATGKRVWFFPRILEEEGSLAELFRFLPDKDEDPPAKMTTRAVVALVLAFSFWLMVKYAPDENTRARYQKRVTNIIDDFIMWTPQMISSGNTTAPANITDTNSTNSTGSPSNASSFPGGTESHIGGSGTGQAAEGGAEEGAEGGVTAEGEDESGATKNDKGDARDEL